MKDQTMFVYVTIGGGSDKISCGVHGFTFNNKDVLTKKYSDTPPRYEYTSVGYKTMESVNLSVHSETPILLVKPNSHIDWVWSLPIIGTTIEDKYLKVLPPILEQIKSIGYDTIIVVVNSYSLLELNATDLRLMSEAVGVNTVFLYEKNINIGDTTGNPGVNRGNDLSALVANNIIKETVTGVEDKSLPYWKDKPQRPVTLSYNELYLIDTPTNELRSFMVLNYEKKIKFGMNSGTVLFGLVYLNKHIEVLSDIVNIYKENRGDIETVVRVSLDVLFSQKTYFYTKRFGNKILRYDKQITGLITPIGDRVVHSITPHGKAFSVMSHADTLKDVFKDVIRYSKGERKKNITVIDITSDIVVVTGNRVKIAMKWDHLNMLKIPVSIDSLKGDKKISFSVPIQMGVDMPTKEKINSLISSELKISLILYNDSDVSVTYFITINGVRNWGLSIWGGLFSNRIFIPALADKILKEKK